MSANPYEPPYCESTPVNAADVRHGYLEGYADGYEKALSDLLTAKAIRAANDALWGRPTGGVTDALQAVADVLRGER